jgi:hypothetical protein
VVDPVKRDDSRATALLRELLCEPQDLGAHAFDRQKVIPDRHSVCCETPGEQGAELRE